MTTQNARAANEGWHRLIPASVLRVVRYDALEAGELFLWRMPGGVFRLGLMVQDDAGTNLRRFAVWLSDDTGHLAEPNYHVLDGGERPVASIGKSYEFHVDPLDPRNRVVDQAWNAEGPALMRLGDSTVLSAAPTPNTPGYRPELVRTQDGRFVPHEAVGPAAVFLAWQLRLSVHVDSHRCIVLGNYRTPAGR